MELPDFLLARIAEDEAVARAATPGPWRYNPGKEWFTDLEKLARARTGQFTLGGEEFVGAGSDEGDNATTIGVAATGPSDNPQSMTDAAHIARHDPARVLAECEAKRRIVEFMANEVKDARRRPGWTVPDDRVGDKGRDYRVGYENARAQQLPDALDRNDRVLRLLALPYADHPDYRQEWRP